MCYTIASRFFGLKECGILDPWPALECIEGEVLTTGPPGKSLKYSPKCQFTFSKIPLFIN